MPFVKGKRLPGQGGYRKNAGRKTKVRKEAEKLAAEIAREYVEKNLQPVLEAYKQLAAGRPVKHYNQTTGELLYTQIEVENDVLRHWIDKLLPAAKTTVEVNQNVGITIKSEEE